MEFIGPIVALIVLFIVNWVYRRLLSQQAEEYDALLAESRSETAEAYQMQYDFIGRWLDDEVTHISRYETLMNEHELLAQQHCAEQAAHQELQRNTALLWTLSTHLFETQRARIMDLESKTLDEVHANWPPTTTASYPVAQSYWWLADEQQDQVIYPAGYANAVEAIENGAVPAVEDAVTTD